MTDHIPPKTERNSPKADVTDRTTTAPPTATS